MDATEVLKNAIKRCDVDGVRQALCQGADPTGVCGNKDGTPLHLASIYGNTEIMKELLKRNADVNSKNSEGQTPLVLLMSEMLSKAAGWTHRAKLLVDRGADIGIKDTTSKKYTAGDYLLSHMKCEHQASNAGRRDRSSDMEIIKEFLLLQKLCQLSDEDLKQKVKSVMIKDPERSKTISEKLQSVSWWSAWDELDDVEMDPDVELLYSSMEERKSKRYCLQFHVVGHLGAGKTSLIRQILKEEFHPEDVHATDCVDVHVGKCDVDLDSEEWHRNKSSSVDDRRLDGVRDSFIKTQIVEDINISTGADDTVKTHDSGQTLLKGAVDVNQPKLSRTLSAVEQDPHLKEFCRKVHQKKSSSRKVLVRAVDFGGHCMFYTTHQIFLTSRGINIIVIDITRSLDDLVEDDDFRHLGVQQKAKVEDFIKFWVKTLKHFTEGEHKRIFIVATHKDKANKEEVNKRIADVKKLLLDSEMDQFVVQEIFCINCFESNDPEMIELRKELVKTAKMDTVNWGMEVPTKWLVLEDRIFNKERKQVMTFEEINEINQQSRNILEEKELKEFLCFHNTIGTLLYYHNYGVRDLVVLDPQWMIDSLKQIITIEKKELKPHLFPYRDELNENGLLKREFVQEVWKCGKQGDFFKHQDKLLSLMEKLNIITSLKIYDSMGNLDQTKDMPDYIVPCMLRPAPGHFLTTWKNIPRKSSSLAFFFKEIDFLPVIFHRLLASCLANLQSKSCHDYSDVYCDKAVFTFSGNHYLLLRYNNKSIVANIVRKSHENINPEVGFNARQFLTENLHGILGNKKKGMRIIVLCERIADDDSDKGIFDFDELEEAHENSTVRCSCSDHDIDIKKILMFWKRDTKMTSKKCISATATQADPKMILNPRLLGRACMYIEPKCLYELACTLGVKTTSATELDHIKAYDKMYHMLYEWFSRKKGTSLKNLMDAMEEIGQKLDTEKLNTANITWREGKYYTVDAVLMLTAAMSHSIKVNATLVLWQEMNMLEDIPIEVLQKTVTDIDIDTEFCRVTGPIFFRLGIELDVDHFDLENIRHNYNHSQERACQMLHLWKQNKRDSASYQMFGDAAVAVGLGEATVQDLVNDAFAIT